MREGSAAWRKLLVSTHATTWDGHTGHSGPTSSRRGLQGPLPEHYSSLPSPTGLRDLKTSSKGYSSYTGKLDLVASPSPQVSCMSTNESHHLSRNNPFPAPEFPKKPQFLILCYSLFTCLCPALAYRPFGGQAARSFSSLYLSTRPLFPNTEPCTTFGERSAFDESMNK